MGLMGWLLLVGVIIAAVVLLGIIDHFRQTPVCAACGQKKPLLVQRVIDGEKRWLCSDCRGS